MSAIDLSHRLDRQEALLGSNAMDKLHNSSVIVFGLGGVGGYVVEALARGGVGNLTLVDADTIDVTNLNRQIVATSENIGLSKVDEMIKRVRLIAPDCNVTGKEMLYLPDNADEIDLTKYDYVVDAIDNVTAKIELVCRCNKLGVPIISSMGTAKKIDPTRFRVADIYDTKVCPLCKVMRKELSERSIKRLKVVYSEEKPISCEGRTLGSVSFVPGVAGLIIGGEVIKDMI